MYLINHKRLEVGDIILTGSKSFAGIAVKIFTNSNFSHAMIWADGTLIHSDGGGVYSKNPQRLLFSKLSEVKVLRMKQKLNPIQVYQIKNHARSLVGTVYSTLEAALVVVPFKPLLSERQFCSRLVAQCYASANINLVKNINFCSPEELNKSTLLYEVPNAIKLASQTDIEFSKSRDVNMETQIDTIKMLVCIRKKYGKKIQTLSDVFDFIKKHPNIDADITKIALDSGYFNHAEVDMEVNSWRYNETEFLAIAKHSGMPIMDLIKLTHDVGNSSGSVHGNELKKHRKFSHEYNLDFFKHHVILYKQLLNTHYLRQDMVNNIKKNLQL